MSGALRAQVVGPLLGWLAPRNLVALHPLLKIALWVAVTIAATYVLQVLFWLLALDDEVFGDRARGFALPLGLLALSWLALAERRPLADFGLELNERWRRQAVGGLLGGLLLGAAGYGAAFVAGAVTLREPLGWGHAGWLLLLVVPGAIALIVQQVIVSGYFLTILRERLGTGAALVAGALLVGVLDRIDDPGGLIRRQDWTLLTGLLLFQWFAGVLRLTSGNVLTGAMLLNGLLCVRRTIGENFAGVADSPWSLWLAPEGDPRRGVLVWLLLAATSFVLLLTRRIAPQASRSVRASPGIPESLKRIYPFAMPMCLVQPWVLAKCLWDARGRVSPECMLRLVAIIMLGGVNALLCLPERLLAPLLRRRRVPAPVFILGVHRSGTTHLHNLLALDPLLVAPLNHHVFNPQGALLCGWPMSGLIAAFLPWQRPMDAVPMHMLTPNEDEFAIANLTRCSPYWGWVFPRRGREYDRFLRPDGFRPAERRAWGRALRLLVSKLGVFSGRRAVLKNPCHTGRVPMLLEQFPDARLIHIHRHPHDVYRSNMHFAREMHPLWQLQDPPERDAYSERFLGLYAQMEGAYLTQTQGLPAGRVAEVAFEELERAPFEAIRRIYRQLDLPFTARFRLALRRYLRGVRGYQKNKLRALPPELQARVDAALGALMHRWGYAVESPRSTVEAPVKARMAADHPASGAAAP